MIDKDLTEVDSENPEPVGAHAEEGAQEAAPPTVEDLQAEISSLQEKVLRQAAEFQNYRKRSEQLLVQSIATGRANVVRELLDILDDLERSVAAHNEAEDDLPESAQSLASGVRLVFEKFKAELARIGVEQIEAVGQAFDEEKHEAMMQQPAPEGTEPGTVLSEIQKGYILGDRVLRHSKVVVAS